MQIIYLNRREFCKEYKKYFYSHNFAWSERRVQIYLIIQIVYVQIICLTHKIQIKLTWEVANILKSIEGHVKRIFLEHRLIYFGRLTWEKK